MFTSCPCFSVLFCKELVAEEDWYEVQDASSPAFPFFHSSSFSYCAVLFQFPTVATSRCKGLISPLIPINQTSSSHPINFDQAPQVLSRVTPFWEIFTHNLSWSHFWLLNTTLFLTVLKDTGCSLPHCAVTPTPGMGYITISPHSHIWASHVSWNKEEAHYHFQYTYHQCWNNTKNLVWSHSCSTSLFYQPQPSTAASLDLLWEGDTGWISSILHLPAKTGGSRVPLLQLLHSTAQQEGIHWSA